MAPISYIEFHRHWDTLDDPDRKQRAEILLSRYPQSVPVIVSIDRHARPHLQRWRFIVPRSKTIRELMYLIRTYNHNTPQDGAVLLASNTLLNMSLSVGDVYAEFRDPADSFLYISILRQESFGGSG